MINDAYRNVTNKDFDDKLAIKWVHELIQDYAIKYEERILCHVNWKIDNSWWESEA